MTVKTFKDLLNDNRLEIGKEAYLNHKKGIYLGVDEEGYSRLKYVDHYGIKKLLEFRDTPHVPQLPLGIFVKQKRTGYFGEIVGYTSFNSKLFYVVKVYEDVFKEEFNETYHDLMKDYELVEENPFKDIDEFEDELSDVDSETNTLMDTIDSINRELAQLEKKRKEITKLCKHDWYKGEREEVSNGVYEQECECNICGDKKLNKSYRFM